MATSRVRRHLARRGGPEPGWPPCHPLGLALRLPAFLRVPATDLSRYRLGSYPFLPKGRLHPVCTCPHTFCLQACRQPLSLPVPGTLGSWLAPHSPLCSFCSSRSAPGIALPEPFPCESRSRHRSATHARRWAHHTDRLVTLQWPAGRGGILGRGAAQSGGEGS